jgi:hypothetical protein
MAQAKKANVLTLALSPTSSVTDVTPEMAERWMALNKVNRNVRSVKVSQYAADMTEGNWLLTGEAIKFSESGRLLDGQHRLLAVIQANVTVQMFVTQGLPDNTQAVMDTGVKRLAADNLHIAGESNAAVLAAVARIGHIVDRDLLYRDRKSWQAISNAQIYAWVEANPMARRSVDYCMAGEPKKVQMRPSVKAYCHFRFAGVDPDAADEFFSSLGSLINIPSGSAIHALSSRLRQLDRKSVRAEMPDLVSMTIRAWNAWRSGRSLAVIPLVPAHGNRRLPEIL